MRGKKRARTVLALLLALAAVFARLADASSIARAEAAEEATAAAEEAPSDPPKEEPGGEMVSAQSGELTGAGTPAPEPGEEPNREPEEAVAPAPEPGEEPDRESEEAGTPALEPEKESAGGTAADGALELGLDKGAKTDGTSASGTEEKANEGTAADRELISKPGEEADREAAAAGAPAPKLESEAEVTAGTEPVPESGTEPDKEPVPEETIVTEPEESPVPGKARTFAAVRLSSYPLYLKETKITFEDGADGSIQQGERNSHGAVDRPAGTEVTFAHCPLNKISCIYCRRYIYWMAPKVYGDQTVEFSDPAILEEISYEPGVWDGDDKMAGSLCMHLSCKNPRPGYTDITSHYYVRYDRFTASGGICPWCWGSMAQIDIRGVWYECEDTFSVSLYADYILEYDANAGDDPVTELPDSVKERKYEDFMKLNVSRQTPKREGHHFLGWAEQEGAKKPQYAPEDPVTLYWTEGPEVKKTLYAVWESEEQSAGIDPPGKDSLEEIVGNLVRVQCIDPDAGHPAAEYGTEHETAKGEEAFAIGEVYRLEDGYFCDIRLNGIVYADLYSQEPDTGIGIRHVLADGEEAVRSITLQYDTVRRTWTVPEADAWDGVLTTFLVTEGKTPPGESEEPNVTVVKSACRTETDSVVASVKVGEEYDYVVSVRNNGQKEIKDLQVSEELNLSLIQLLENSPNYENSIWNIPSLPAQETAVLRLHVKAMAPCEAYENTVGLFQRSSNGEFLEIAPGPGDQRSATVEITGETEPGEPEDPKEPEGPPKSPTPEEPAGPEEPETPEKQDPPDSPRKHPPHTSDRSQDTEENPQIPVGTPVYEPGEGPRVVTGIAEPEAPASEQENTSGAMSPVPIPVFLQKETEPAAVEVADPETPLGDGRHRCCILHFCILLLALILEECFFRNRKEYQKRMFEIRKEIVRTQSLEDREEEREC